MNAMPTRRVIDVGGGANPSPLADYVVDGLPYEKRGALQKAGHVEERFSRETWVQLDLCARTPWPFPDKYFDYAYCTHVLEDVRDPVWVCSEIRRIAKAGYISTPSRIMEQSLGVEHPSYAGYYHHRWLVSCVERRMVFRHKPHSLHVIPGAVVAVVGPNQAINPAYANFAFEWSDDFAAVEELCFEEQAVARELCEFADSCRNLKDLKVRLKRPWLVALKRWVYYQRLRCGR